MHFCLEELTILVMIKDHICAGWLCLRCWWQGRTR